MTKPTQDELAMQWRGIYPNTRYGAGEWRRYTNGHWPMIDEDAVELEILGVLQANRKDGISPTDSMVNSVKNLARLMVKVADAKWDAVPGLVVMRNGTLDLASLTLGDHNPDYYITGGLDFDYDKDAQAPSWETALKRLAPDVVEFLREYSGYSITTDTRNELAIWLYGLPGGGKSTFLEGLRAMLGGRVCNLNLGMIEKSSFGLTTILGKTLAVSAEQPADFLRSTHVLNSIISGEMITVDIKFKDPVDIIPRVKVCWAMNEFPRIPDAGNGIFRRVKVVTFAPIPGAEVDLDLKNKIRGEAAGIFNWALAGLKSLTERGRFVIPPSVEIDTRSFQKNNDVVSMFVEDRAERGDNHTVKSSALYSNYRGWCEANGHKARASNTFAEELKRLGFGKKKQADGVYWSGLRLNPESAQSLINEIL